MYCGSWAGNGWGFWVIVAALAAAAFFGWNRGNRKETFEDRIQTCPRCGGGVREEWVACPKCGTPQK